MFVGGVMDRLDCQFLMAFATFIHLKTFVLGPADLSLLGSSPAFDAALNAAARLQPTEKEAFISALLSK